MGKKSFDDLIALTKITCENGKVYSLCNDGNLYEELKNGTLQKMDRLNDENREVIKRIMERLRPAPIDDVKDDMNNGRKRTTKERDDNIQDL